MEFHENMYNASTYVRIYVCEEWGSKYSDSTIEPQSKQLRPESGKVQPFYQADGEDILVAAGYVQQGERGHAANIQFVCMYV